MSKTAFATSGKNNLMNSNKIILLEPPHISDAHIKEKVICIRSHRERIFRTDAQLHNNKLILHNYGHGGAGWTFLFGCVHKSIRQFEYQLSQYPSLKNKPICVIGAGCYGLLTANILARKGYAVRIVAEETEDITSYKAAGFFFARPRKRATDAERLVFEAVGMESYMAYRAIATGTHDFIQKGALLLPAYFGRDMDPGFAPYIQRGLVESPQEVVISFNGHTHHPVHQYTSIFIDSITTMQELKRAATEYAIPLTKAKIKSFDEIDELIVFNCAGPGAPLLASDRAIVPVQGHLIVLKNQPLGTSLDYMINVKVDGVNERGIPRNDLIYYAPKQDGILGITFIRGQSSTTTNHHEFDRLLQRCRQFFGR